MAEVSGCQAFDGVPEVPSVGQLSPDALPPVRIASQIEQRRAAASLSKRYDQFPIALTDGRLTTGLLVKGSYLRPGSFFRYERSDFLAVPLEVAIRFVTGKRAGLGHPVHHIDGLIDRSRLEPSRPADRGQIVMRQRFSYHSIVSRRPSRRLVWA